MMTHDDTVLFVIIRVLRGRNKYVEQKISPMQCIDFRKIAYLYGVIARKRTMTYIKKRFWLRSAKPKSGKFHRRPMEKINRSEELLEYNFLMFCIRPRRSARCVLLCIQKHGAMFSVFILQGFSRCLVSMIPRTQSRASFCVEM